MRFQHVLGRGTRHKSLQSRLAFYVFRQPENYTTKHAFLVIICFSYFPNFPWVFATISLLCQEKRESFKVSHQDRRPNSKRESEGPAVKALQGTNSILGRALPSVALRDLGKDTDIQCYSEKSSGCARATK